MKKPICHLIITKRILLLQKIYAKTQHRRKTIYGMIFYQSTKSDFNDKRQYCHKAKLIIEIDGSQHYTDDGVQKDDFRTEILEGYDLKVIRFTNREIDTKFNDVCEYIDILVKAFLREEGGPR